LVGLITNGSDDRVKLSAQTNLLDRVGLGDKKKEESAGPTIIITAGLAQRLTIVLDEDRDDVSENTNEGRKIPGSAKSVSSNVVEPVGGLTASEAMQSGVEETNIGLVREESRPSPSPLDHSSAAA
jgi:hypothetical protein